MNISVIDMPVDPNVRAVVAQWCCNEWAQDFPHDTVDTYIELYEQAMRAAGLPVTLVAMYEGEVVGTASLLEDDALPQATEPGPWLATVFVEPSARKSGVASALVAHAVTRASVMGHDALYLYTRSNESLYARHGFTTVRRAPLGTNEVTVMVRRL